MTCRAICRLIIAFVTSVLSLHAVAAAAVEITIDPLDAGMTEETRLGPPRTPSPGEPVTSIRSVTPLLEPERPLTGNPLWAIPLTRLPETRDRPIFSPSRRARPPVVAAERASAPPPPPPQNKDAEPPALALVGTIASDEESFGIFLDQSTKRPLRLRLEDDYQGWKLRAVRGREATIEKDRQRIVLRLPQPGQHANDQALLTPVNLDDRTPVNFDGSTPLASLRRH